MFLFQLEDGAIEEGVFYETALFASSQKLALCIIIENNDWSMSTITNEREDMILLILRICLSQWNKLP